MWLTADWDFPISRTVLDHGAIVGLAVLLALVAAAWRYRRRFPLAAYGFLAFLMLMAPTSSILPIQDPVAERRLYFAMLGLLLIVVDLLARWKIEPRALAWTCALVLLAAAGATHARAAVWRPGGHLGGHRAQIAGQAAPALPACLRLQRRPALRRRGSRIRENGRSSKAESRPAGRLGAGLRRHQPSRRALAKLQAAAALQPTAHVYSQIGMVYAKRGAGPRRWRPWPPPRRSTPIGPATYVIAPRCYFQQNQLAAAVADYRRALALDPALSDARDEFLQAAGESIARQLVHH